MIRARPYWTTQFFDDDPFIEDELEYYSGEAADTVSIDLDMDTELMAQHISSERIEHIAG